MTFYRYMMNFENEDTPQGHLARDIKADVCFPKKAREYDTLADYFNTAYDRYEPNEIDDILNYCYDMYNQYELSRTGGVMRI